MICLTCGRYISGDAELERATGGFCQCPRLTEIQRKMAAQANALLRESKRDDAEDLDDPDYGF